MLSLFKNIIKLIKTCKGLFKKKGLQETLDHDLTIDCSDLILLGKGATEMYAFSHRVSFIFTVGAMSKSSCVDLGK